MIALLFATACSPKPTTTPTDLPAPTTDGADAPTDPGTTPPSDTSVPCETSECGPAMGMPNSTCPDGKTVAGPTCGRDAAGVCGWQVVECPK